jgi:hypothetical protein
VVWTLHAVPLDYRALSALKHSALALDVYTWLAHRLCRIDKFAGVMLSWQNLRDQFGQEYADSKDFKREFRDVLRQVTVVFPPPTSPRSMAESCSTRRPHQSPKRRSHSRSRRKRSRARTTQVVKKLIHDESPPLFARMFDESPPQTYRYTYSSYW